MYNLEILFLLAILPVVLLASFIYKKDAHKEPMKLLRKLFGFGCLTVFPIIVVELFLAGFFDEEGLVDFIPIFIYYFICIGSVEEFFKWIVVRLYAFNDKEYDEVYDIIVYSVFVSLGFACIENIMYVFVHGAKTAILRAITSIPGHTCFGVIMGYYYSKSKVAQISNNKSVYHMNMLLSILVPTIFHTLYDAIISYIAANITDGNEFLLLLFVGFDIFMVIYCFNLVNKMSKVQQNLYQKEKTGVIVKNNDGTISVQSVQPTNTVQTVQSTNAVSTVQPTISYCPVCGHGVKGFHYCAYCGYKVD